MDPSLEGEKASICNAISYQMGEWPTVFETVSGYLNHLLFVIGNGVEIDEGTSSPLVDGIPMHQFPAFDRGAKQLENRERWLKDAQQRLGLSSDRGEAIVEKELVKHVYPLVKPANLTRDAIHAQIAESLNHPRRKALLAHSKGKDNEYAYARPYPLNSSYSPAYGLTEKSPKGVIWVAREFCHAWFNYLTLDLETGNFYKGSDTSYSGEDWTRKHCKDIGKLAARFDSWLL